jgi:glycosyltransferase involved in cell wall biosynthesis
MNKKPKIAFFITEDWYFVSHRLPIAIESIKKGFDVYLITKKGAKSKLIESHGIKIVNININRGEISPISDLILLINLIFILKKIKPNILHTVAMKPILYGNIASFILGIPHCISSFAGLGYIFISKSIKAQIVSYFLKIFFRLFLNRNNNRIIFQNRDDLNFMIDDNIIKENRSIIIRGSGVNGGLFNYTKENNKTNNIILASRLLWDKGIGEFVKASKIIKENDITNLRFIIVGEIDSQNPTSVEKKDLLNWAENNLIEWWGFREDINKIYEQSNIVCLPSYREGLPKSLIEAAACGRAIIATDVPGCREIVIDGYNGLLVPKKNAQLLAEAIIKLIKNNSLRNNMGENGVKLFKDNFTIELIVSKHIELYINLLKH